MWQARLIKALPYIILVALIVAVSTYGYNKIKASGFKDGAASVQEKWDEDTDRYNTEIDRLKGIIATKEEDHRKENQRITHELAEADKRYQVELARADAEYQRRVQLSSQRATIYQHQAEGGAAQCRDLASHAAKLDSSLEEGRSLVRELRGTVELRDGQIRALSDQILNDRKLFNTDK